MIVGCVEVELEQLELDASLDAAFFSTKNVRITNLLSSRHRDVDTVEADLLKFLGRA